MTTDQALIFAILAITLALFVWGRWRHDVVAIAALMACVLAGLTPSDAAFTGFGNPAVITVGAVLVLSYGLQSSGAVEAMAQRVIPRKGGTLISLAALVSLGALLSAFMNNVGAMALLMPIAMQLAGRHDIPPGKILMPLAFGTILGGMTTLIGTPPNLIVSQFRAQAGEGGFAMFDFTPVGLGVALLGIIFAVLAGRWLVPGRNRSDSGSFDIGTYLTEVHIAEESKAVGKTLGDVERRLDEVDAQIVGMVRNDFRVTAPYPGRVLRPGDILVIEAEPEGLGATLTRLGLKLEEAVPTEPVPEDTPEHAEPAAEPPSAARAGIEAISRVLKPDRHSPGEEQLDEASSASRSEDKAPTPETDIVVQELVVQPGSAVIGRSASDLQIRTRYSINLLAISRKGHRSISRLRWTELQPGDVMLMQGLPEAIAGFAQEHRCIPLAQRAILIPDSRKAYTAVAIMAVAVLVSALGLLPAAVSFTGGVLAYMLARILPLRRIYESVDWPIIVLLGALFPLAAAMAETGAADLLAQTILDHLAQGNPVLALTLVLIITMTLSDFMNNAATAAVMCPIALGISSQLDSNPDTFLMAVAIGASCAFLTPIGHQNNTLILGPGGFRFGDYWRLGLPMEILVVAASVPLLLWVWPL
jgi:di/tricarboxylate transporter